VTQAQAKHVPVIDYDTLINGVGSTYFVGSADEKAGELQATALVAKLKSEGVAPGSGILMVDGPADSQLASLTAKGAHSVIDASGYTVLAEFQTPGGVPNFAATWAQARFTELGSAVAGVYAANDGLAAGVLSAAGAANVDPSRLALTGRGASFAAIQNLLADHQLMTLYAPIKPEADMAATLAVGLAGGTHPNAPDAVPATSGGTVPAFLLTPVVVTKANIKSTVITDRFDSVSKICTRAYAAQCAALGIH
jgi:D-xylose transport system substrate-binding protein